MSDRNYLDFDLLIEGDGDGFKTRVLHSPAGEPTGEFTLPFSDLMLENLLLKLGKTRSGTRSGGANSTQQQAARELGSGLYESLFSGSVGESFAASLHEAEAQGVGLRLRLRLENARELLDVPWEFLYDEERGQFLVLTGWTPVVRYPAVPVPSRPMAVTPPLRVLVAISRATPPQARALDVEQEWERLQGALAGAVRRGIIEVHRLPSGSLGAVNQALAKGDYHAFHYVGHSTFDASTGQGVLWFEGEDGVAEPRSGNDLAQLLGSHRSMKLAVFNSCEGSRASAEDPFAGVALSLVQKGVPAVIAMQFEITDDAAITFARDFYTHVADGDPIDAALADARRSIFSSDNDVEWGTPVLFLRAADGMIFDIDANLAEAPPDQGTEVEETPPPVKSDGPSPAVEAAPPPSSSRRWWIAGAAAAAAAVLGIGLALSGGDAAPETTVQTTVQTTTTGAAEGAALVRVPDVLRSADPVGVLQTLGLRVDVTEDFSDSVAKGRAVEQSPAPGEELDPGSTVSVVISLGPRLLIAFESDRNGNRDIYVMDAAGTVVERLTGDPGNDRRPVWSPDGTKIAFVSDRDGDQEVFVMNADGSDQRAITANDDEDVNPAWSPDGTKLAFRSNRDGNFEIYVMDADGANQRRLTSDPAADARPAWSPTGEQIVFDSDRDGDIEVYVMNADGSGVAQLTANGVRDSCAMWSPDGTSIAFRSDRTGNGDIYVMASDGSGQERRTQSPDLDATPSWSSDSSQLIFHSQRNGNFDIYVMDRDGGNQTKLTASPDADVFASWAPS